MDKDKLLTLSRPHKLCANCNAPIDGVDRHASAVVEGERDLERLDYCAECWEHIKGEIFESYWMARREPKSRRMPKLNRRQRNTALRALFESLRDRQESEDVTAHLFLISHLLMKWGGLRWRENGTDLSGAPLVIFEDPVSGDRFEVPDVDVGDQDLLAVKGEIEDFLRQFAPEDDISL